MFGIAAALLAAAVAAGDGPALMRSIVHGLDGASGET
jgi:hypothetical protein